MRIDSSGKFTPKRKLLAAAVLAALGAPATAWGQACQHLGGAVQCPVNPGTGLPLPPGSSSLAFVPGGTNWLIFGNGTVFIPQTTFAAFVPSAPTPAPAPPIIGSDPVTAGAGPGIPISSGIPATSGIPTTSGFPTTVGGQLALVGPASDDVAGWSTLSPRVGSTYQLGEKTLLKANYALYADQIAPSIANLLNPVSSQYLYTYFDDRNGDLIASRDEFLPGQSAPGGFTFYSPGIDPDNPIPLEAINSIDPDLKSPKTHEVILGLTRQVGRDVSVGVTGTYRRRYDETWSLPLVQDAGGGRPVSLQDFVPVRNAGTEPAWASGQEALQTLPYSPGPYSGADLLFQKRFSDRWSFATNLNLNDWKEHFQESAVWSAAPTVKSFVLPHVLEKSGRITATQYTFDTTIFSAYPTTGTAPTAAPGIFLFDGSVGASPPATASAGGGATRGSIRIDDLVLKGGPSGFTTIAGFGVIVVGGADPGNVALQGFVVNSHSSAYDLSVFGFDPQPLAAASRAGGGLAAPALNQPVSLTVPASVLGSLTVSQVAPQPTSPAAKPATSAVEPAGSPETRAVQEASQRIVRGLASADANKQQVAREALKIANPETKRLVGQIMASNRIAVSQTRADAANYNAEAAATR